MSTVRGQSTLAEQRPRREWSRTEGWQTVRSWVGTNDSIDGLVAQLQAATGGADRIAIFPDGPVSRLEAYVSSENAGAQETAADTWELVGNDLTKNLLEHPKLMTYGEATHATITAGVRAVTQADPSNVEAAKTTARAAITTAVVLEGKTAAQAANALAFFTLMLKGTDAFSVSQYVLRKTSMVSSKYTTQISFAGVAELWTAEQIETAEDPPASIIFDVKVIPTPAMVQNGYVWRWLKRTPSARAVARNKQEITKEFWLEAWSTDIYAAYTPS